uniref:Synaptophysin-like n=1 Tax=Phallusia mammillata TaxID=59560 RepID=A0A6F9DUT0_9ASCI|nr:synaptophysin-like [Phallusia mammillata]
MDTSSWRIRVLLEPRGFIRVIEIVLSIVAFSTTGGYHDVAQYTFPCENVHKTFNITMDYPFRLSAKTIVFSNCSNGEVMFNLEGDLSPSAQWFMFVGVTAFLYSLAAVVFYVVFDANIRQTHEGVVTKSDLAVTIIYAFLWLTAASAWAWGLGQVKIWSGQNKVLAIQEVKPVCEPVCTPTDFFNYGPLNASVAFGFLNFFLWSCNVWFVYKESPYHQEPDKQANPTQQPPNTF